MSLGVQATPKMSSAARLAREALAELEAEEPDRSPVELLGGQVAWGLEPLSRVEASRDPANAPAMRPHVVAPCQQLARHRALRLHCTCGRGLDFLALAAFATGVLVVSSPRLRPVKRREGGTLDLAAIGKEDPEAEWTLSTWEASMWQRASSHATAWNPQPHPALGKAMVVGDAAKRQLFHCKGCGATHTLLNVTLLGLLLRAIAAGSRTVRLSGPPGTAHVLRPESSRGAAKSQPAPLPQSASAHICTIWCSGGDHIELAGPLERRSDKELTAAFERLGLEVTLIEPTPDHMNLPGVEPGRLVWFRTRNETRTEII